MPAPIRIWLEMSHHPTFRIGGWAFVRQIGGQVSGAAGGERRIDPERTSLAAIAAALAGLPAGAEVELQTASPLVLAIPGRLAGGGAGEQAAAENLDLWARTASALEGVRLVVRGAKPPLGAPTVFAAAWAEFARDRAKDRGAFAAPIPKSNLAQIGA